MALQFGGLQHLGIRVTDLARARAFYVDVLGFQAILDQPGLVLVRRDGFVLGIRGDAPETAPDDQFNPFRVGLDHVALAVSDPGALGELKAHLDRHNVRNNGIEDDAAIGATYISFYDPDGIAWEFYARRPRPS